jgi:cobalt-zinc-cadmium efflux system protein
MGRGGHGSHGHGHGHGHAKGHGQEDAAREAKRVRAKLIAATVFAFVFMCIEIAGGIIAGSLAIVTDAAHLFTDIANFITAILASHLAIQPASITHSYGGSFANLGGDLPPPVAEGSICVFWLFRHGARGSAKRPDQHGGDRAACRLPDLRGRPPHHE